MITVLVADDHAMVREGLRALLSSMEGYELVGTASTGADAIREAVLLSPDLLVLDIGFPDLNGIEVVRRLAKAAPSVKILMLTMYDDDESILGAVRAGALGLCAQGRRFRRPAAGDRRGGCRRSHLWTWPRAARASGSERPAGAGLRRTDSPRA